MCIKGDILIKFYVWKLYLLLNVEIICKKREERFILVLYMIEILKSEIICINIYLKIIFFIFKLFYFIFGYI